MDAQSYEQAMKAYRLEQGRKAESAGTDLLVKAPPEQLNDVEDMFGELKLPTESMHEIPTIKTKLGFGVPTESVMLKALNAKKHTHNAGVASDSRQTVSSSELVQGAEEEQEDRKPLQTPPTFAALDVPTGDTASQIERVLSPPPLPQSALTPPPLPQSTLTPPPLPQNTLTPPPLPPSNRAVASPKKDRPAAVATTRSARFDSSSSEAHVEIPSKLDLEKELDAMVEGVVSPSQAELLAQLPLESVGLAPLPTHGAPTSPTPSLPGDAQAPAPFSPAPTAWQGPYQQPYMSPYQQGFVLAPPVYRTQPPPRQPQSSWWLVPACFVGILALGMLGFWLGSLL